ncbi:MAG: outer membrane beta-barrel protein [Puia sp.]|nr:outer membrane beta-barrel protein [Puia sp.]
MSDMNDNNNLNMDDLFKRAAEGYPLRTDSADWDKVLGAMEEDEESFVAPPYEQEGRRSRRRFLWLLLLLPLGGLGYYAWHKGQATARESVVRAHPAGYASSHAAGKAKGKPAVEVREDDKMGVDATSADERRAGESGAGETRTDLMKDGVTKDGVTKDVGARAGGLKGDRMKGSGVNSGPVNRVMIGNDGMTAVVKNDGLKDAKDKDRTRHHSGKAGSGAGSAIDAGDSGRADGKNETDNRYKTETAKAYANPQSFTTDPSYVNASRSLQKSPMAGVVPMTGSIALNVAVSDRTLVKGVQKPAVKPAPRFKGSSFYAGVAVAPDMSYVKFQSVKGVGYTVGVLLGYNINSKLALETGLYYDMKKYYTDGDYFNKKSLGLPSNYYLQNVDGSCNMWEIPLNVRYNFGQGEKIRWFATTGLSTYLMTKEQYAYEYEDTNTGARWPEGWSGRNSSNYLFSVFNLSLGFERSLGKIGNLRLEPYLRVPLAGFGKGSLPIMSSGLSIGITRRIR